MVLAGPVAFLLGLPMAACFLRDFRAGTNRVDLAITGFILGLPMGLADLTVTLLLLDVMIGTHFLEGDTSVLRLFLPAALAGGAGLGFGTALGVSGRKETNEC